MAPTILIKFCGFIVHSKPNNVILANFPGKIPETWKISFLIFFRLLTQGLNQLINLVLVNISSHYFCFRPTLKIKGSSHRKKLFSQKWHKLFSGSRVIIKETNKLTKWQSSGILQTWSIVFVAIFFKSADSQEIIVISHLKSTAYRNKSLSN